MSSREVGEVAHLRKAVLLFLTLWYNPSPTLSFMGKVVIQSVPQRGPCEDKTEKKGGQGMFSLREGSLT